MKENQTGYVHPTERTSLYEITVGALKELAEKEGTDKAEAAIGEVMHSVMLKEERRTMNIGDFPLLRKLLWGNEERETLPLIRGACVDHPYGTKEKEKGRETVVLQPYGLSSESAKNLLNKCDEIGAEFWIDASSIHYYGRTISIRIQMRGKAREKEEK